MLGYVLDHLKNLSIFILQLWLKKTQQTSIRKWYGIIIKISITFHLAFSSKLYHQGLIFDFQKQITGLNRKIHGV